MGARGMMVYIIGVGWVAQELEAWEQWNGNRNNFFKHLQIEANNYCIQYFMEGKFKIDGCIKKTHMTPHPPMFPSHACLPLLNHTTSMPSPDVQIDKLDCTCSIGFLHVITNVRYLQIQPLPNSVVNFASFECRRVCEEGPEVQITIPQYHQELLSSQGL